MEHHETPEQRIARMQREYDAARRVLDAQADAPDTDFFAGLQRLSAYYGSGLWLRDYERDERGELPAGLKRGVLSQDALYDLLTEACCRFGYEWMDR